MSLGAWRWIGVGCYVLVALSLFVSWERYNRPHWAREAKMKEVFDTRDAEERQRMLNEIFARSAEDQKMPTSVIAALIAAGGLFVGGWLIFTITGSLAETSITASPPIDPRQRSLAKPAAGPKKVPLPLSVNLADLTLVGWLLALVTVGLVVGLMAFTVVFVWDSVRHIGRGVALLIALPGLAVGVGFFALGAFVLNATGLPVARRRHSDDEPPPGWEERRAAAEPGAVTDAPPRRRPRST